MFKELSNKELVTVTHGLGKTLGADTPLIDIAKLLAESATRLDVAIVRGNELQKQLDAVVAENVALINYIDGECFTESKRTGVYTCAGINKPASASTDAILNALRAEVVASFWRDSLRDVGRVLSEIGAYHDASEAGGIVHDEIKERVDDYITKLRGNAAKDGK